MRQATARMFDPHRLPDGGEMKREIRRHFDLGGQDAKAIEKLAKCLDPEAGPVLSRPEGPEIVTGPEGRAAIGDEVVVLQEGADDGPREAGILHVVGENN